jgi:hypothetical protein
MGGFYGEQWFRGLMDTGKVTISVDVLQWDMLYQVLSATYHTDQLAWDWMQKIVDKTMTALELAFLNTVPDSRVDRGLRFNIHPL